MPNLHWKYAELSWGTAFRGMARGAIRCLDRAVYGGGFLNAYAGATLVDCSFVNNAAASLGGGLHKRVGQPHTRELRLRRQHGL